MIIAFTRQLYTLIKTGIPILQALQIISAQLQPGKFKTDIEAVIANIQEGMSFSESLSATSRFFSPFYINMIKAAEVSGKLSGILKELSEHLIQNRRIAREVQSAFMYPIFILVTAILLLTGLLMFILPVFVRIFEDLGGRLPPATLLLIGISKFITHWGWIILTLGIVFTVTVFILYHKTSAKYIISALIWRIPLFGRLIKLIEVGRFSRSIGTLLSSGVTLMKSLEVLHETTTAVLLQSALADIRYKIEQGKNLSLSMEETGVFPLTLVRVIQVGEETGKIADLFLEMAQDYEEEVSFTVSGLLSILEPTLIVVMGAIVGFIVVSLFFPILTLSSLVK